MSPILQTLANSSAYGYRAFAAAELGDFQSIATVTVGSGGSSSITFSSIPSTFQHLQIRAFYFAPTGDNLALRLNGDTTGPYPRHQLYGDGASTGTSGSTSQTAIQVGISGTSSGPGSVMTDILDYGNTNKYKTVKALCGYDANGSGYAVLRSGLWTNTNAVTSISLFSENGNISEYSSFALYGIKG